MVREYQGSFNTRTLIPGPLGRPLLSRREVDMEDESADTDAWGTSFSADAAAYGNGTSSPLANLANNGHSADFGEFVHERVQAVIDIN